MGVSSGLAGAVSCSTGPAASAGSCLVAYRASIPAAIASTTNGSLGKPGTSTIAPSRNAAMPMGRPRRVNCCTRSVPRLSFVEALLIRKADDVEMIRAGTWLTKPSPTVRMEYMDIDSPAVLPCIMPTIIPPMRLTAVMTSPATASPRTNLLAPSMAP